mgnify:CR=1 FL=1
MVPLFPELVSTVKLAPEASFTSEVLNETLAFVVLNATALLVVPTIILSPVAAVYVCAPVVL